MQMRSVLVDVSRKCCVKAEGLVDPSEWSYYIRQFEWYRGWILALVSKSNFVTGVFFMHRHRAAERKSIKTRRSILYQEE